VLLVSLKGACCGGHAGTGNAGREQLAWRTDADPHRLERKTRCSSSVGTLAHTSDIDMPASTHEMVRSPDGGKFYASVHGGGTFVRNEDAGRHIAVIDLASRTLEHFDVAAPVAPHSVMMDAYGALWSTGELNDLVMAIDPRSVAYRPPRRLWS